MKTRQLGFWTGDFGNKYVERNLFSSEQIRERGQELDKLLVSAGISKDISILEIGANIGVNLKGLRRCGWNGVFYAVEPNRKAYEILVNDKEICLEQGVNMDGFDLPFQESSIDMVFTCGVLIHVHPDDLLRLCSEIHRVSRRYVLCVEYFSPEPVEVKYRGHDGMLFKRDFGGFYLDRWPELRLLAYGFLWKRVSCFDDVTWWLFQKLC
ncbi:MAG: methyltransferase domain-containing protein [Deltaproteobacteria bacterium]|nr:methyltransferase domain-containing protein [Deltaproteobacteria bacterium]